MVVAWQFGSLAVVPPLAYGWMLFALALCDFLDTLVGNSPSVYIKAGWEYDVRYAEFDNTAWTWATDYLLVPWMGYVAYKLFALRDHYSTSRPNEAFVEIQDSFSIWSCLLFLLCLTSVLFGGIAHQTQLAPHALVDTPVIFRTLWMLCVGSVTLAVVPIGICATKLHHWYNFQRRQLILLPKQHQRSPLSVNASGATGVLRDLLVPEWIWVFYGFLITYALHLGYFSFQRPAADIFVVGAMQTPPTAYLLFVVLLVRHWSEKQQEELSMENPPLPPITPPARSSTSEAVASPAGDGEVKRRSSQVVVQPRKTPDPRSQGSSPSRADRRHNGVHTNAIPVAEAGSETVRAAFTTCFFFLLNAPLILIYPMLIKQGYTLATINTYLHFHLAVAWGGEALGLLYLAKCTFFLQDSKPRTPVVM